MSKPIRNPEAYNAARIEKEARREQRINQIISSIEYAVRRGTDFYGKDIKDVAWQLRVASGVLGKFDRKKDRSDDYGNVIIEALERARHDSDCPIIVRNGVRGIIVTHANRPDGRPAGSTRKMGRESSTLPMKFVRKYADVTYPPSLFVHPDDEFDLICDPSNPRFRFVKGVLPRELIDH